MAAEHAVEEAGLLLEIAAQRIGNEISRTLLHDGRIRTPPVQQDQPLGLAHRQEAQQHLIDQREDPRVRADAQGEREHGGRGEARTTLQRAQRVAHIARRVLEPRKAPLVAQRIHRLGAAARLNPCEPHGLVRIVTATSRVLRHQLQVQPKLLLQVVVASTSAQRCPETMTPLAKGAHHALPCSRF